MSKIRLFYSYSHQDEKFRDELEKHLSVLRDNDLIDEWHDRKIGAGDELNEEIETNMCDAHVILLLFSSDFINSSACKHEVRRAMELKKEKGTTFIPIILRQCAWKDVEGVCDVLALPKDGKAIKTWDDQDEAWLSVYEGIKDKVTCIRSKFQPVMRDSYVKELQSNPVEDCQLDDLFVFPDLLKTNTGSVQTLEHNEIDSIVLCDLDKLDERFVLIEGEEQCGKTSLCNMLCKTYSDRGLYPIKLEGADIRGKANIEKIVSNKFEKQYDSTIDYWAIDKEYRVLLIDDVDEWKANEPNFSVFVESIPAYFQYAILLIDKVYNLSDKSAEHNYFSGFRNYAITRLGHVKRDELIKKCIAHDENIEPRSCNPLTA